MTETFSSLWRRMGGMSLKDAGVDPTNARCSSSETDVGTDVESVTDGILNSDTVTV